MDRYDRIMKLASLLDAEIYGQRRKNRMINLNRQIKLEINKYRRNGKLSSKD